MIPTVAGVSRDNDLPDGIRIIVRIYDGDCGTVTGILVHEITQEFSSF